MSSTLLSYLSIELTASKYVILIFFIPFITFYYCEANFSINYRIDKTGDKFLNNYKDRTFSTRKSSEYQRADSKQNIGSEYLAFELIVKKLVILGVVVASVGINRCISFSLLLGSACRLALAAALTSKQISTSNKFYRFSVLGKHLFHFRKLFSNKSLQTYLGDILFRIQKFEKFGLENHGLDKLLEISA